MKVVYLHQYFKTPRERGGTRSYEMARRLVSWGHEVEMVTADNSGNGFSGWQFGTEAGIHIHRLSVPYDNSMGYYRRMRAFFRFAVGAARKAAALKADVIFATSTPLTIVIPAVYASRKQKIPMVFEVRDLWPELPIAIGALKNCLSVWAAKKFERWAYRNSSHIVGLSPGMKKGIVRTGYPEDRVKVIPNSCDIDLFEVPSEKGDIFRGRLPWLGMRSLVVYAGTLGRINGVEYLAHMAAHMAGIDPEIRFLALGDGAEYEKVRRIAGDTGVLEKNFFMMRSVPKQEMPGVLSAANVAVSLFIDLPEMWNNSANKFFDALAAGRPVAINYGGWQSVLLRESGAGIELPAKDPQQAAVLLAEWVHDRRCLQNAQAAARLLAHTRFSRDMLARQLEQVLLDACRGVSVRE